MKLNDIIDLAKKKSETRLHEIREQLSLPLFRKKEEAFWNENSRNIVVVGSGIGGMASAALFAKAGHCVTVLERHPALIGGHGRCLTIEQVPYSMGPQYVWEFGEGKLGNRFLGFLGLRDTVPFIPMARDGFERIFIGERDPGQNHYFIDFKVPMGLDPFRTSLKQLFPEESGRLDGLFDDMKAVFGAYKSHFRRNSANEGRFLLATKFLMTATVPLEMKLKLGRIITMTVREFFDHHGISPLVRRILYGHGGIFAENESDMSAIAFIIGTGNYHEGAWYPQHGFHHFFQALASVIRNAGGCVLTGKTVIRLETLENRVARAVCDDGSAYACDVLFSDISPRLTAALLGRETDDYDYTPSHSIPTCCIGLQKGLTAIAEMKGRNYWWQDGREVEYHHPDVTLPPRMLFVASPSANGFSASFPDAPDGLVVFCPGNYHQEKQIHDQGARAISAFKRKLADDILSILDQNLFPGIRAKVLFAKLISSVDIERQTGGECGNAYGRRLTAEEILKGPIRDDNMPENLYNVSATKNSPGIAGGIFTAELMFKELTGREI